MNKGLERDLHSAPINASDPSSAVFEGIKEGVQGMSRLLAAGFSTSASTPASSPSLASSSFTASKSRPPSLIRKSHSTKESSSSISTFTTSRSGASNTRFSQSSMSSYEGPDGDVDEDPCDDRISHGNDDPNIQILMVRDTGATPTMSPNPEFHHQQTQQLRNKHHSPSRPLVLTQLNGSVSSAPLEGQTWTSDIQPTTTNVHRRKSRESARLDFEHLDFSSLSPSVLLSPPSMSHKDASPGSSPRLGGGSPSLSYLDGKTNGVNGTGPRLNSSSALGGLAPMSSIPGLGSMTTGAVTPPVGSWMDSMGKKLGQLQRSST